jgi:Putative phage tail protein
MAKWKLYNKGTPKAYYGPAEEDDANDGKPDPWGWGFGGRQFEYYTGKKKSPIGTIPGATGDGTPTGGPTGGPTKNPQPKPIVNNAPTITNNRSVYDNYWFWGNPIPVSFGRRKVPGTVMWTSDIRRVSGSEFIDVAISFGYKLTPPDELGKVELITLWANGKKLVARTASNRVTGNTSASTSNVRTTNNLRGVPVPVSRQSTQKPRMTMKFYDGSAIQKPDDLIVKSKTIKGVPFRNMMYVVLRNFCLTDFALTEPPLFEALIGDSIDTENIYDRASAPGENVGGSTLDPRLAFWNKGSHQLQVFESESSPNLRIYDYSLMMRTGIKNITATPASPSTEWIYHSGDADPETGLLSIATGNNGVFQNRALHVIDPKTGRMGTGFYGGLTSQQIFNSTSPGTIGKTQWGHAGANATDGLFLCVGPGRNINNATGGTVGICKIDPVTLAVTFVAARQLDVQFIDAIWASDERRTEGYATFYAMSGNNLHRLTVHKSTTALNADATLEVESVLSFQATGSAIGGMYDSRDNSIIIFYVDPTKSGPIKFKLPIADGIVDYATATAAAAWYDHANGATIQTHGRYFRQQEPIFGSMVFYTGQPSSSINIYDTTDGFKRTVSTSTCVKADDPAAVSVPSNIQTGAFWDSGRQALICIYPANEPGPASTDSRGPGIFYPDSGLLNSGKATTIADTLRWLMLYAGYKSFQLDFSDVDLTDVCFGGLFLDREDVWDVISQICTAYGIVYFESEGVIKFVRKLRIGSTPSADFTVTGNDLIPVKDGLSQEIAVTRAEDIPYRVELGYIDVTIGYSATMREAKRLKFPASTTGSENGVQITLPLVLDTNRAKTLTSRALYSLWEEKFIYSFVLPSKYLALEPGDTIHLQAPQADGSLLDSYVQVRDLSISPDYELVVTAFEIDHTNNYVFTGEEDGGDYSEEQIGGGYLTNPLFYDVPTPELVTDTVAQIIGATTSAQIEIWSGGRLFWNSAGTYLPLGVTSTENEPNRFLLTSDLPSARPWVINDQSFTLVQIAGKLRSSTVSNIGFLAGRNLALIGSPAEGFEYIQFRDVLYDTPSQTYTFTNLVRGRRGTENQIRAWAAGTELVLIKRSTLVDYNFNAYINQSIEFRGAALTAEVTDGNSITNLFSGNNIRPFGPANPKVTAGNWGAPLTIYFFPRSRGGYELPDIDSIAAFPMEESPIDYKVEILNDARTSVLRTFMGLSINQFVYSAVDQATDFPSGEPERLQLRLYQKSSNASVGYGFPGNFTLLLR